MKKINLIPVFDDQEMQRRASLLVVTQFAVIAFIPAIALYSWLNTPEHSEALLMGLSGVILMLVSYALLRFRKLEAASWIVVVVGWLIFSLDLVFIAGIRGVSILGQVLILLFTGLAISGRSALIMTLITITANFFILQLELSGLLAHPLPLPANTTRWFNQTSYTIIAAFYIWLADRSIRASLSKSRETADRYRALFERTNDGVVIFDLNWSVLSANHQALKLLGYERSELIGFHVNVWEAPNGKELMDERRTRLLEGDNLPIFEGILKCKDGSSLPVEMSMALVHDASDRPLHVQCIIRDITERKEYENQLQQRALYDPLTNLPNRALFEERYQQVSAISGPDLMAVLFVDLDNFKWVNDEFGHAVGDQVLKELGKRLQLSLRETDTVARLGGDEFVIILEKIRSKEDVSKVASKILNNISEPLIIENNSIEITASIGINITDNKTLPYVEILKNSDYAMYQVKDSGKNDFRFFDPEFEL